MPYTQVPKVCIHLLKRILILWIAVSPLLFYWQLLCKEKSLVDWTWEKGISITVHSFLNYMYSYTVYCLSFAVNNFRCFMSLLSFSENVSGYLLLQAFIVFTWKNLPKTFTVANQSTKNMKGFTANSKQYKVHS